MKSIANGTCLEIANTHFPTINKLSNKRVYCGAENNKEKLLFLSTQRLYNKKYKQQRWYGALKRFFLPPIIEKEQPGWLWLLTCGTIVWDTKPILNFTPAISLVQSNYQLRSKGSRVFMYVNNQLTYTNQDKALVPNSQEFSGWWG